MTLNEYIRTVANLKAWFPLVSALLLILMLDVQGTKKSCLEGGCGACVVSLTQYDVVQQKNATISVNSVCLSITNPYDWPFFFSFSISSHICAFWFLFLSRVPSFNIIHVFNSVCGLYAALMVQLSRQLKLCPSLTSTFFYWMGLWFDCSHVVHQPDSTILSPPLLLNTTDRSVAFAAQDLWWTCTVYCKQTPPRPSCRLSHCSTEISVDVQVFFFFWPVFLI